MKSNAMVLNENASLEIRTHAMLALVGGVTS
jgi:hypothetical protein